MSSAQLFMNNDVLDYLVQHVEGLPSDFKTKIKDYITQEKKNDHNTISTHYTKESDPSYAIVIPFDYKLPSGEQFKKKEDVVPIHIIHEKTTLVAFHSFEQILFGCLFALIADMPLEINVYDSAVENIPKLLAFTGRAIPIYSETEDHEKTQGLIEKTYANEIEAGLKYKPSDFGRKEPSQWVIGLYKLFSQLPGAAGDFCFPDEICEQIIQKTEAITGDQNQRISWKQLQSMKDQIGYQELYNFLVTLDAENYAIERYKRVYTLLNINRINSYVSSDNLVGGATSWYHTLP
jgi:hypothetical protein